jgi:hypothetical protein
MSRVSVDLLTSKMAVLDVNARAEEAELQNVIESLVAFVKDLPHSVLEVPLSNTTLPISATEWQALTSVHLAGEISFRGELHRVLTRSVGLLASMQEELALYHVRKTTAHLFKKHLSSLVYLAHETALIMPEVEKAWQGARSRGLKAKAEHLSDAFRRMDELVQQIAMLNVPQADDDERTLRCDPKWMDSRLQEVTTHLVAFARTASQPAESIALPHSELPVSATEWQVLTTSCPPDERSFRADVHRAVRRATGLLAAMQEELALYRSRRASQYQWKRHFENLRYLVVNASDILPELEAVREESKRRSLSGKHDDLQQITTRLREKMESASTLQ